METEIISVESINCYSFLVHRESKNAQDMIIKHFFCDFREPDSPGLLRCPDSETQLYLRSVQGVPRHPQARDGRSL